MAGGASGDPIWEYFQTAGVRAFAGAHAHPRLEFLIREVGRRSASKTPRVLNVGIGDGHFERLARERGWSIASLDPHAESVAAIQAAGVDGRVGRLESAPFAAGEFDCVVVSEVLEHMTATERRAGLLDVARMLKPGGLILGTVPYRENLDDNLAFCPQCRHVFHRWGHTTSFDLNAMRGELSPAFDVIVCRVTAFVPWNGRSLAGKAKSLARVILAKCGAAIAVPNILFVGRCKD